MRDGIPQVVGLLGLGRMGNAISRHLVRAGFRVQGYDPKIGASDVLPSVKVVDSEREAVVGADVILMVVGFDDELKRIVSDPQWAGSLSAGQVIVVVSTVQAETIKMISEVVGHGVKVVDAPVCRGQQAADDGTLLAVVGGAEGDVQLCRPVLDAFCSDVVRVGGLGAGQVVKMANNVMLWANYFGIFDAMRLMHSAGVDLEQATAALMSSSASSWALGKWPDLRPVWAADDLEIAGQVAAAHELEVPVTNALAEAFRIWPSPEETFKREYGLR